MISGYPQNKRNIWFSLETKSNRFQFYQQSTCSFERYFNKDPDMVRWESCKMSQEDNIRKDTETTVRYPPLQLTTERNLKPKDKITTR